MIVTKVERTFEAAHHNGPEGSRCHTPHGHSWTAEVTIFSEGFTTDQWGWSIDFSVIKEVIDQLDHQDLNTILSVPPSAENIALWIQMEVLERTDYQSIVKLSEGHGNSVIVGMDEDFRYQKI